MKKLIYIYPQKSSFINSDIAFLSKYYEVKTQDLQWSNPKKLFLNWMFQKLFLLKNIWRSEVIIISFAGYFSLIPVVFGKIVGKKTLLILNGTDCVSFPEYNYGSLRKPILRFFVKHSQRLATKLLPVDESLITQIHTFDGAIKQKKQGVLAFFPKIKTPITIIPNGFDTKFWKSEYFSKRKEFITVVSASKKSTAVFKGVDLFVEMAKEFPSKQFTIVGLPKRIQDEFSVSKNVSFIAFVPKEKLRELYNKHQFYVQLSINEGFGCALSEAMLCGCIPVFSNSGALPTVAGSSTFKVEKRSFENTKLVFDEVLKLSEDEKKELSKKAQQHVFSNFRIEKREKLMLNEIKS